MKSNLGMEPTRQNLGKNTLATLAYYDAMDFPLTTLEVWKYYMRYFEESDTFQPTLPLIEEKLRTLSTEEKVAQRSGFWTLPGREALVEKRIRREKLSAWKLRRMRRLIRVLVHLPFVRMIGATGSLALRHAEKRSDWDMFVVLKQGSIWTGRTVLTLFLHVIGKRRHGRKVQDRACLNYYITDGSLMVKQQDWFSAHEYQSLIAFFDRGMAEQFFLKNSWIKGFRPNFHLPYTQHRLAFEPRERHIRRRLGWERLFSWAPVERRLALWQEQKIARNPKTKLPGSLIIANAEALVFLPKPKGPKVYEAFRSRLTF